MTNNEESTHALRRQATARRAGTRLQAAHRLGHEPAERAIPLLLELLSDKRTNVQKAAADSLRPMEDPRGRRALIDALDVDSEWTRVIAAQSLADEHELLAWPVLESAFASEDIDVFGPAMEGIWRFEPARARSMTERLARDARDTPFLREMAVRTLGWEGTLDSLPAIEAALTDRRRHVRKAAQDAIAHIKARCS